jgi:glutathione synthase
MNIKALFVCDALHTFATYKDTTFAMMRECIRRGIEVHVAELHELRANTAGSQAGLEVLAHHVHIDNPEAQPWWIEQAASWQSAENFCAIFMRKDPPFNVHYFVATQLLEIAQRQGVRVFNDPKALRDHGEKMSALEFAHLTPATLISADIKSIKEFAVHHEKIVAKPLDAMGGTGVFVLTARDPNLPSALEVLSDCGRKAIVAQQYIPEITEGDKRIIIIDGTPVDFALARVPQPGHSRGNLAAGATARVIALSARDREIAKEVGSRLSPRGLLLIGIDVIGSYLTEINVTSPTGFQEITNQSSVDVAAIFMDAVQKRL